MPALNIAYLHHVLNYGGSPTSLYLLQKSLRDQSYRKHLIAGGSRAEYLTALFAKENETIDFVKMMQLHHNQVSRPSLLEFTLCRLAPITRLIRILQKYEIDILHLNTTCLTHILEPVKKELNIKVITHVREMIPKHGTGFIQRYMIDRIHRFSDAIIAISPNEAYPFRSHQNLFILPNPFDFTNAHKTNRKLRNDYRIPSDTVIIGMLGQLHPAKGHLEFLKAIRRVLTASSLKIPLKFVMLGVEAKRPPVKRRIIKTLEGRSDFYQKIISFIRANQLEPNLIMLPPTMNIFEYVNDFDIVVRPAVTADPWGRDIIESMALKKPIIATGTSEFYVENGINGYLVPPQDPCAMADRIIRLVRNPAKREQMGTQGFKKVRRMCDLNAHGLAIAKIYERFVI